VDEPTVIVMVEVPAPVIAVGLNPTVTSAGWPVADKAMTPLKPPVTVLLIVATPELPCATVTEEGEADRLMGEELPTKALSRPDPFGLPHPVAKS